MSTISIISTIASCILAVAGVVSLIISGYKHGEKKIIANYLEKIDKENVSGSVSEIKEQLTSIKSDLDEFRRIYKVDTKQNKEEMNKIRRNLLDNTRSRLIELYKYYIDKEDIDENQLYVLNELYDSYQALGGNSFILRQKEDINDKYIEWQSRD